MKSEYNALMALKTHPGWEILQALWAKQGTKIMEGIQKAGARGQESAWRYYAGQMKGFDLAITQLERALLDMQDQDENLEASLEAQKQVEELLKKVKGEGQ